MNIVAKAVLADTSGKILVLRRSGTHPTYAYQSDFPGGDVDPGESELEAVVREIMEEAGIAVAHESLELVHQRELPDVDELHVVFAGELPHDQPPVVISWEHDQYEWVTPAELLQRPLPAGVDDYYETALHYIRAKHSL